MAKKTKVKAQMDNDKNMFEYEYKSNNNLTFLIFNHATILYSDKNKIFFELNIKQLRKVKMEILYNTFEGRDWKKIFKKTVMSSRSRIIEHQLVQSLTDEINKQIIDDLKRLSSEDLH